MSFIEFLFPQNVASQTLALFFLFYIIFSLLFQHLSTENMGEKIKFHAKTKEPRQNIYNLKIERRS